MNFPELLYTYDLLGSFAFALSGALVGVRKRFDIIGILVLAVITGMSGGVVRSLLLGDLPNIFLTDITYFFIALFSSVLIFILRDHIFRFTKLIKFFDAVGLSFFFASSMTVALSHHLGFISSILIGILTASFGGVIRDILSSEVPLIFRKELYTVVCLVGGLWYFGLYLLPIQREYIVISTMVVILLLRFVAIQRNWSLPR